MTIDNEELGAHTNDIGGDAKFSASAKSKSKTKARKKLRANTAEESLGNDPTKSITEDRGLNDWDDDFDANLLPELEVPGYHTCWGSKTNNYDSLQLRFRDGYTITKPSEVKNYQRYHFNKRVDSGKDSDDSIEVNEMISLKIPMEIYLHRMNRDHHRRPMEHLAGEVSKLRATGEKYGIKSHALSEDEGYEHHLLEQRRAAKTTTFSV